MVRSAPKTCPNLSRLIDETDPRLLSEFLKFRPFEKLDWLKKYRFDPDTVGGPDVAKKMLQDEKKERLKPLESEAARVLNVAGTRGQYALSGLAQSKLPEDREQSLMRQRDELARSFWAYLYEPSLFDAVENALHLRLYRRYDKHYQTFMVETSSERSGDDDQSSLERLLAVLKVRLDRGEGYFVDRFDIPAEDDEPSSRMYLIFHPNPPTSVREMDDQGNRSRIYFRPPGEAMIVHTPTTGRVHVRAGTRKLRHEVAETFAETVLDQKLSDQPVDFQAYDISRFFRGFDLPLPGFEDVIVLDAKVIRAEVSVGNLASRLALSTTMSQDIGTVIDGQPGLEKIFQRAVAIRFIEIAVRYQRRGRRSEETLDFTVSDRNTSSLLSLDDPFQRVLGHRLLRCWKVVLDGRAPNEAESIAALPGLLALWDIGSDKVTGAWLKDRGIDVPLLTGIGFLVPAGWEGDELLDDEDDVGQVAAEVVVRPEGPELRGAEGHEAPGGSTDRYRVYRVRQGWVAAHLRERLVGILDVVAVEEMNSTGLALGTLPINDRDVPIYLVRGLDDAKVRAAVDTDLRARADRGIGLVLQAGSAPGSCIAANVLSPAVDHIVGELPDISLSADSMRTVFLRNRVLAQGGQTVELRRTGDVLGTLSVPGKGTIDIKGEHRLIVIERLVEAHNGGPSPIATEDLIKGIEGQSLANIFKQPLWNKLKAKFVRRIRKGEWEIAI